MPKDLAATLDISSKDVDMTSFSNFSGKITNTKVYGDLNGGGALIHIKTSDGEVILDSLD